MRIATRHVKSSDSMPLGLVNAAARYKLSRILVIAVLVIACSLKLHGLLFLDVQTTSFLSNPRVVLATIETEAILAMLYSILPASHLALHIRLFHFS